MKKIDAFNLSVEINGASMIIQGLANQCDDNCDYLTNESLKMALHGVCSLLDRISDDVEKLG